MKKLKRAACILLALVMTLSMTVTAFADETDSDASATGSITITNATIDETYHVYKLFDATYSESVDEDGNTVTATAYTATAAQKKVLEAASGNVFVFTALSNGDYQVTIGTKADGTTYSDEEVIAFVKSFIVAQSEDVIVCYFPGAIEVASDVAKASTVKFSNLPLGYYFVTSSLGSVVSLSTTNPTATITDKNTKEPSWDNDPEEPVPDDPVKAVLEKTVDEDDGTTTYRDINKETVSVGDILTYQISYTNDSGVTLDKVVVTDAAPEGTEFVEGSMAIYQLVDGSLVVCEGTTNTATDGTLTWTVTGLEDGATLVVEFQVMVTEAALKIENRTVVNDADLVVTLGGHEYNLKTNVVENPVDNPESPVKDVKDATYDPTDENTQGSIDGNKVDVGNTLTYTIEYTNTADEAVDLTIVDAPPAGTVYVAGSASSTLSDQTTIAVDTDGNIKWVVDDLAVGATVTVYFQVKVTEAALSITDSTIVNTADYSFDGENYYKTNVVKNPTEDEPDEPEDEDFGKVILNKDGTESTVSTGAFGDTVTFDVSIDAVNNVADEGHVENDENTYTDQVKYYYIYDKMDPGFDLDGNSFKLTINDVEYNVAKDNPSKSTNSVTYTIKDDEENVIGTLFTCEVYGEDGEKDYTLIEATIIWADEDGNGLYPNCEIHLTYDAIINEDAVIAGDGNVNSAIYDYSVVGHEKPYDPDPENPTYPSGSDLNHETEERTTVTYTYALGVYKTSEETGEALEGAEFTLVDADENAIYAVPVTDGNGAVQYYNYTSDSNTEGATSTFVSNSNGQIIIKGVDIGTYTLTEVKAPDGYVLLTDPKTLEAKMDSSSVTYSTSTITTTRYFAAITEEELDGYDGTVYTKLEDGTFEETVKPDTYAEGLYKLVSTESDGEESEITTVTEFEVPVISVLVANAAGSTLPGTGGMGTTLFYLVGGILVLGAAVLLITRRRMSRN